MKSLQCHHLCADDTTECVWVDAYNQCHKQWRAGSADVQGVQGVQLSLQAPAASCSLTLIESIMLTDTSTVLQRSTAEPVETDLSSLCI